MLNRPNRQRGAVLIFALLVLLVMTVLGVSGVGNSVLQERMAGNYQQSHASLQSTEFALQVAQRWMVANITSNNLNNLFHTMGGLGSGLGLYSLMDENTDMVCQGDNVNCAFNPRSPADWCNGVGCPLRKGFVTLGTNALTTGTLPTVQSSPANLQPQFIIEYLGRSNDEEMGMSEDPNPFGLHVFRVTAIGWGSGAGEPNVLQSNFHIPL